jgi:hypothetical protein
VRGDAGSDVFNALWQWMVEMDAREDEENVERMLMGLARYGKLGVPGDLLGWDDVEARQVMRYARALGALLEKEGPLAGAED